MMQDEQLLRYSRQIMLPDVDIAGQEKLLAAKVLIIGMGGLGCPVAMYLAAAGVGELHLVDFDTVELTNLQRQIGHGQADLGRTKVASMAATLRGLNPELKLVEIERKLTQEELCEHLEGIDLIVDATDNFATRFMINRASLATRTPLISGAAIGLSGQITVYDPTEASSPCYRCLYTEDGEEELTCANSGVLAPVVGMIGTMQAVEALKYLVGFGRSLVGRLQVLDAKDMSWRELKLKRDPACPCCSVRSA